MTEKQLNANELLPQLKLLVEQAKSAETNTQIYLTARGEVKRVRTDLDDGSLHEFLCRDIHGPHFEILYISFMGYGTVHDDVLLRALNRAIAERNQFLAEEEERATRPVPSGTVGYAVIGGQRRRAIVERVLADGRLGVHFDAHKNASAVINREDFRPSRAAYFCFGGYVEPEWEGTSAQRLESESSKANREALSKLIPPMTDEEYERECQYGVTANDWSFLQADK